MLGSRPNLLEPFPTLPERVLLYTGEPAHWDVFSRNLHTACTPELIHALADRGVTPRRDRRAECGRAHQQGLCPRTRRVLEREVLILEGLNLHAVDAGEYDLICLPLNLPDADASPVRAVLRRVPKREQG